MKNINASVQRRGFSTIIAMNLRATPTEMKKLRKHLGVQKQ